MMYRIYMADLQYTVLIERIPKLKTGLIIDYLSSCILSIQMTIVRLKYSSGVISALAITLGMMSLAFLYWSITSDSHRNRRLEHDYDHLFTSENKRAIFVPTSMETIHIAEILYKMATVRKLITFVKSLLLYRTNPIHLHAITNVNTAPTLRELFGTWDIPHFQLTLYVRPDIEEATSWIPYMHPAGGYAFKKLMMDQILLKLRRVIFYDSDIVLTADIYKLWKEFDNFDYRQAIGMGYETQYWYKTADGGKFDGAWQAIDWGFNTGMILYDLERLRRMNWTSMWNREARKELKVEGYALLAEQDVFNVLFVHHPEILYQVPCKWNMQFGERANIQSCPNLNEYVGLHTTLVKLSETNPDHVPMLPIFWDIVKSFDNMNGGRFSENKNNLHRVLPYAVDINRLLIENTDDVTLVLFMKSNEMKFFKRIVDEWPGPMSVAISGTDEEFSFLNKLSLRGNIGYHYLFLNENENQVSDYLLKTIALRQVLTSHFIIGDIRYHLRNGTYEILKEMVINKKTHHVAIPSFESKCYIFRKFNGKSDIWRRVNNKQIITNPELNQGLFVRWGIEEEPFNIGWKTKFDKYITLETTSHPLFQSKNNELDYEEMTFSNDWLVHLNVTVLPSLLAIKIPFLEEAMDDPKFSVNC
ncbi:xylosyl- and glucuronyltransferase LARGE2-like [Styela clava]